VSDVIPSTPVFEMYPIGFLTIAEYLAGTGYRVRILNAALRMLRSKATTCGGRSPGWTPGGRHRPPLARPRAGALELASLVKEANPRAKVVLRGHLGDLFPRFLLRDIPRSTSY